MSNTATAIAAQNNDFDFVSIFTKPENTGSPYLEEVEDARVKLTEWLNASGFISALHSTVLSATGLFQNGRLIVTFVLNESYRDKFALLRGLLEFSRPKGITISANRLDRTFQLQVSPDQVDRIKEYLETILNLLAEEIRFKASLKSVIAFENKVRLEQEKVYEALWASV